METKEILTKRCELAYLVANLMGLRIKFIQCMIDRIDQRISYPEYVTFAGNRIQIIGSTNGYSDCPASSYEKELGRDYDRIYRDIREMDLDSVSGGGKFSDLFLELPNVVSFVDGHELIADILTKYFEIHKSAMKEYEDLSFKIMDKSA